MVYAFWTKANRQLFNFWLSSKNKARKEEVIMITSLSKQSWTLALFVSLLFGFILSFWPKSSFSQTVLSQQQAGSVLAIEKVAVAGRRNGHRRNSQSVEEHRA